MGQKIKICTKSRNWPKKIQIGQKIKMAQKIEINPKIEIGHQNVICGKLLSPIFIPKLKKWCKNFSWY